MAAACEKAAPGRLQYVIVGGREPGHERYFDAMEKLMKDLGVEHAITVIGQVRHEEIPAMLSHAAVLAHLPNYQEGLGGVILEAMAMAVPVVAFDSGGVGECFVSGEHGFLVKQYDVAGAADRVMRLASDDGLRKRLGAAARAHVAEAFSPSGHFARIDAVYHSLLSRR